MMKAGFEVLTAVTMKSPIFWDVTRFNSVKVHIEFIPTTWCHIPEDGALQVNGSSDII
jgi:hypothetical protein